MGQERPVRVGKERVPLDLAHAFALAQSLCGILSVSRMMEKAKERGERRRWGRGVGGRYLTPSITFRCHARTPRQRTELWFSIVSTIYAKRDIHFLKKHAKYIDHGGYQLLPPARPHRPISPCYPPDEPILRSTPCAATP